MDYRIRLEKLEEAVLTPEQKMKAWAEGDRKENVKACSDEKLKVYYDICVQNGYTKEANTLRIEARNRGLTWAQDILLLRIQVSDLNFELFKYVRDHSIQDTYKNYHTSGQKLKDWLTFLLYAIVSKQYADIEFLKKEISKSFDIAEADIKAVMRAATKDHDVMEKLEEFILVKESLALMEEKLYEAPEKHDTLNPKL